jgi:hypothetical protein
MEENNDILSGYYKKNIKQEKKKRRTKIFFGKGWFYPLKLEDRPPSVAGGFETGFYVA